MNPSGDPLDVVIIGAGLSGKSSIKTLPHSTNIHTLTYYAGICAGIQLQSKFKNATFEIFDKANDIGGTWSKNTYPDLSCDIPSQVRSFLEASFSIA
jgi:cation diffusion facilitator CzcD-associated flavoprotein CzcO